MPKAIDISGQRFGRLAARERVGSTAQGKALWSCDCDCGTKHYRASQNLICRGATQSCGCLRQEFLNLGLRSARIPAITPRVAVTYPIPDIYPDKPLVNDVARRRYQFRWERVEMEVRRIQRGEWREPELVPFVPRDQDGNRIERLDLIKLGVEKRRVPAKVPPVPDTLASFNTGASLADRVRVLTEEEWARL
jgi:hypothetical protein